MLKSLKLRIRNAMAALRGEVPSVTVFVRIDDKYVLFGTKTGIYVPPGTTVRGMTVWNGDLTEEERHLLYKNFIFRTDEKDVAPTYK